MDVPVTLAVHWTIFQRESDLDSNEDGKKEIQVRLHCKSGNLMVETLRLRCTVRGERFRERMGFSGFWPRVEV